MPLVTTLNAIRRCSPCEPGWVKLLGNLGKTKADDEVLNIETILDSNGIDDALWCLRAVKQTAEVKQAERLFGIWCARKVKYLMTDHRSLIVLNVAERFANGEATDEELADACAAARAAAWDAARAAAWDAARPADWDAARAAARAAAWVAAMAAAGASARDAARDAVWDDQYIKFRAICQAGKWVD